MEKYLINGNKSFEITRKVKELIQSSRSHLKAANFLFEDAEIIDDLKEALDRNVAVFIISNLKGADNSSKKNESNMNIPYLKELEKLGAHCRMLEDLHAKFIISDSEQALLMSANFSSNSLGKNTETGIEMRNQELRELEYTFDKLFLNSDIKHLSEQKGKNEVDRQRKPIDKHVFAGLSSRLRLTVAANKKYNKESNLVYCNEKGIYESILAIIKAAKEYLYIVTWHFNSLERLPEFNDVIKAAINRGVNVYLYSNDKGQVGSLEASVIAIQQLEKMGCKSYGDDNNHSKCVLSEKEGIIFTANIDGNSGLKSGFEVGCILTETQRQMAENHIQELIKNK